MGLFDKKYCSVCGEKIGLLGNRKLSDGNLCKDCAKKLSPWFSDRRSSTVDEIKQQLAYREENRGRAAQFKISRSVGEDRKLLLDETHRWFTVTRARDLEEANPDILDYSALTGCRMDIDEGRSELMREGPDGKELSYNPPRYEYSYDFNIIVSVDNPYFDEMRFRLNSSSVHYTPTIAARVEPDSSVEYSQYRRMGEELCSELERIRTGAGEPEAAREAPAEPASPAAAAAGPWTCPACGGANSGKFCEYCGTPRP